MIHFFRQLRKEYILTMNTTTTSRPIGKYLKYALGEIALVMIGILLALQVNNWNESRKQVKAENEFIKGVKNDLVQDKEYMQMIIGLAEGKKITADRLNQEIHELYQTDRAKLDSLLGVYFKSQRTFYPIYGSFESAISGNELSKFKNKNFTSDVTKLYNSLYARLMDNALNTDNRWHFLTREYSVIRRTGHFPNSSPPEIEQFLNDLSYHMYALNYFSNNLREVIKEIDIILEEN